MIEEQVIRQLIELNQKVDGMAIPEKSPDPISPFQDLPGLVGFWPMSSVQRSTGDVGDMSNNIVKQDLTYNGNPTFNIYNDLVPYIDLDGTGDFLSVADNTDLDIIGTETIYNSSVRGLTLGGWFWFDDVPAANEVPMSKATVANVSYYIIRNAAGVLRGNVSTLGTFADVTGVNFGTVTTTGWHFVVFRFIASTDYSGWLDGAKTSTAVGVHPSIFNGTAPFTIGELNGGNFMDGRASLCFLCANALPDAIISSLFEQTRALFGV